MNMTVRAERASGTTTKEGTTTRRTRQPVLLVPGGGKARHTHVAVEQREGTIASNRAFPRVRRDRIYPDTSSNHSGAIMSTELEAATEESKRLRRQRLQQKKQQQQHHLKVDTKASSHGRVESTPRTAASTPSTPNGVRGSSDLRSPGTKKTPRAAAPDDAHPDFITQTDRYGNATTPRSVTALQHAQEEDYNDQMVVCSQSQEVVDVCAETFLDSLRIMCCCLVPDESDGAPKRHAVASETSPARLIRSRPALLPKIHPDDRGKKCLVLDLDETLVHSSFRAVAGADFVIPVQVRAESYGHKILTIFLQIEDVVHFVYVAKRPGVDEFLTEMAKHYELVIYTASLNKYADPLLDLLDPNRVIRTRLFRESCVYHEGNYVKDLSKLDRDLSQTIIIDNSPNSYSFHPENAIDCSSFIDDPRDRELDQIGAFLTGLKDVRDVRGVCRQWREWPNVSLHDQ